MRGGYDSAYVEVCHSYTNIVLIQKDEDDEIRYLVLYIKEKLRRYSNHV